MLMTNPLGFGIRDLLEENAGHEGLKFVPLVGSVSVFILLSNLLGVIPTFSSPTARSAGAARAAPSSRFFISIGRASGITASGGYLKHFAGPVWWLAPLMFPVEIISTCARMLSLTVRLLGQYFRQRPALRDFSGIAGASRCCGAWKSPALGGVLGVFPALIPLAFIGLHIFVSIIQTYVFTLLPVDVYRLRHGGGALIFFRLQDVVTPLQCEPGCLRMSGTTSWRQIHRRKKCAKYSICW